MDTDDDGMREAFEIYRTGNCDNFCTFEGWQAACKWQLDTMADKAERLAEHLYGHSREKAIEWAKEDKFDSCYRQAEEIIELLQARSLS